MSADVTDIYIGQARVQREGTLKAILGSCVGVALFWKAQGVFGLAHCLLPEHPSQPDKNSARFVNHGIISLLELMKVPVASYGDIEAVIAGGGNMTAPTAREPLKLVGAQNTQAAKRWLAQLGIKLVHEETGGDHGRRIFLHCQQGSFHIEKIPKLGEA